MNTNKKPANLMLTTSKPIAVANGPSIKLIDFGLSSWMSSADGIVGSYKYFSPELAHMDLKTDGPYFDKNCRASDIYALGVTFTWLFSGRSLYSFATDDHDEVLQLILDRKFSIPASIKVLSRTIPGCLSCWPFKALKNRKPAKLVS